MSKKTGCPPGMNRYNGECSYIKKIDNYPTKIINSSTVITLANGEVLEIMPRYIFLYGSMKHYKQGGSGRSSQGSIMRKENGK